VIYPRPLYIPAGNVDIEYRNINQGGTVAGFWKGFFVGVIGLIAVENHIEKVRDGVQQKFHQQMRSMTRQKSGVNLEDILPELDSAISVVVWAYSVATGDYNFKPLITSANDYEGHSERSAHYSGAAIDFRIKDMGSLEERRELVDLIREELGERFVVLHEDVGKNNEHLHVQLRRGTYERNVVWK
jgi:hypothetical protein